MKAPDDLEILRLKLHSKRESMSDEVLADVLLVAMFLAFAVPALVFIHDSGF